VKSDPHTVLENAWSNVGVGSTPNPNWLNPIPNRNQW
jgi:hypothetical protein